MRYSIFKSKKKTLDYFLEKFKKNNYLLNDKLILNKCLRTILKNIIKGI